LLLGVVGVQVPQEGEEEAMTLQAEGVGEEVVCQEPEMTRQEMKRKQTLRPFL
jgi:hypothetical protein